MTTNPNDNSAVTPSAPPHESTGSTPTPTDAQIVAGEMAAVESAVETRSGETTPFDQFLEQDTVTTELTTPAVNVPVEAAATPTAAAPTTMEQALSVAPATAPVEATAPQAAPVQTEDLQFPGDTLVASIPAGSPAVEAAPATDAPPVTDALLTDAPPITISTADEMASPEVAPMPVAPVQQTVEAAPVEAISTPEGVTEASSEASLAAVAVPPALPEAPPHEPPRPLVPGAFLRGEFEIKELLARGPVNFYLAHGGDYDAPLPMLIAERNAPSTPEEIALPDVPGPEAAAMETAPATIEAPLATDESLITESASPSGGALQSPLFPPHEAFVQDDREYAIFNYEETTSLDDRREPTNDARYLKVLDALAHGLLELEEHGLKAAFSRDTLRFDNKDELRYYGFYEPRGAGTTADAGLEQLQRLNGFLLRHVFAEMATMRLDDEFGALALSEEAKSLARGLSQGEYSSLREFVTALDNLLGAPDRPLRVDAALLSDVGQERELNEDSGAIIKLSRAGHLTQCDFDLYVVADGMGGHEGGEVASDLTITALQSAVSARTNLNWNDNPAIRNAVLEIIDEVNAEVVALTETPKYRGLRAKPGATLTFALRLGKRVFVGNVGDSRAYKWNAAHGLERISKDHSYVQNLLDQGAITEEEAWEHPEGSIITSHIGIGKLKIRDAFLRLFAPGDKLLLVSDGVVDMLRDVEIEPFLHENDAAVICRKLVDASNQAGGADNITVVCVVFS